MSLVGRAGQWLRRLASAGPDRLGLEVRRRKRPQIGRSTPAPEPGALEELFDATEGMISLDEFRLLFGLATEVRAGVIVEVGSYRGRSTTALACGAQAGSGAEVYAIEPHRPFTGALGGTFGPEDRAAFFRTLAATGAYRNTFLMSTDSPHVAPGWDRPIGLLWLDGDHSYEGVRRDVDLWLPWLQVDGRVALDDSTNPELGPCHVVNELLDSGEFALYERVGPVTVLERRAATAAV